MSRADVSPIPSATGADPATLNLGLEREDGDWSDLGGLEPAIAAVGRALAAHAAGSATQGGEASIVLGSDALLRRLNASYRGKDAATNVLAFAFTPRAAADQDAGHYLGDVVLARETIGREAAARGLPPLHHVQHLALHGLLHLIGYDHETDAEAAAMERLETEILTGLGLGDPHAATVPSDD